MSKVIHPQRLRGGGLRLSDDHAQFTAHARHRGEGWIARASFSFLRNAVELMSIEPLCQAPLQRTVNHLLDDIQGSGFRNAAAVGGISVERPAWRTSGPASPPRERSSSLIMFLGAKQIDDAEYDAA